MSVARDTIPIPPGYVPTTTLYLQLYTNSKTHEMELGIYGKATPAMRDMSEHYTCLMQASAPTFEEARKKLLKQWHQVQKKLYSGSELQVKWQSPRL